MPRPDVRYEDTFVCLLKRELPRCDIIDRSARGSSTARLVTEGGGGVDLLETYMPGIVITQLGMSECAPRLFNKRGIEYRMITRVLPRVLQSRYISFVKRHRVRKPDVTDLTPEEFRSNLINFFERAEGNGTRVLAFLIARPTKRLLAKSPFAGESIDRFNSIYRETAACFTNVTLIEPFSHDVDVDDITVDEFHLTPEGGKEMLKNIMPHLKHLKTGNMK